MAQAKKKQPTRYLVHLAPFGNSVADAIEAFELQVSSLKRLDPNLKSFGKKQSRVSYVVVEARSGLKDAIQELHGVEEVFILQETK